MFSIGETAKLNDISIQTLRHYDKEGILKPNYINEETGYRYYSIDQFLQIDFIKRCKLLGFSLEKIKLLLFEGNNLENILESVSFQKFIIEREIENLEKIKNNLINLEKTLEKGIEKLNKNPKIENLNFYVLGSSKGIMKNVSDIENHIRKALKIEKQNYNLSNTFIILKVNKDNFLKNKKTIYDELIIGSNSIKNNNIYSKNGISIYVESAIYKNNHYFENLIDFQNNNNLNGENYFLEIYYISKLDNKNKEYSLINIFYPLMRYNENKK